MASHPFFFFPLSTRVFGMSSPECRRNALFYVPYTLQLVHAALDLPICLLLAFGDLGEEPNNQLAIVRKR